MLLLRENIGGIFFFLGIKLHYLVMMHSIFSRQPGLEMNAILGFCDMLSEFPLLVQMDSYEATFSNIQYVPRFSIYHGCINIP